MALEKTEKPFWPTSEEMKKEIEEKSKLISEEDYLKNSIDYAISGGWVKADDVKNLENNYLKPIYQLYLEIIEDVKKEKDLSEEDLKNTIRYLNYCLEATRRIGSTDSVNIFRTIADDYKSSDNRFVKYALIYFSDELIKILKP